MTAPWAWPSSRASRSSPSTARRRADAEGQQRPHRAGPGLDRRARRQLGQPAAHRLGGRPPLARGLRAGAGGLRGAGRDTGRSGRSGPRRPWRRRRSWRPAASASNRSLIVLALVSPSISSARLIATAARWAMARAISASSSANARAPRRGDAQHADALAARRQRRDQHVGQRLRRPQRAPAAAPAGPGPVLEARQHHLGRRGERRRGQRLGMRGQRQDRLAVGLDASSWQTSASSSAAVPRTSTSPSSAASAAAATCWASSDRPVSASTRRRSRS